MSVLSVDVPSASIAALPQWLPPWSRTLAEQYFSGTTCQFVLHGNVHDLIAVGDDEQRRYANLPDFLATQLFGAWDIVLSYDLGRGLRPLAGSDPARLQSMVQYLTARLGEPAGWPREPEKVLLILDKLVERSLLEETPGARKKIAILLEYAAYLAPAGDITSLARGQGANLVRILSWAENPYIKRLNIAFCLVAEKLHELNDRLVQSPHVAAIDLPMPDVTARRNFIEWARQANPTGGLQEVVASELAALSNGLTLVSLNVVLSQSRGAEKAAALDRFRQLKKAMIERQCQGLVEFIEPEHTLDLVVGQEAAKQRLREDADLIMKGQLGAAPMGYLLCGPVGTGKTFLAECYAGSIGIPCVKLRNFRSKYVGETEGNLEQVLSVLRSLGPVLVMIDEADAALGNRGADGDSGTSSRVFSMIAGQMGDTRYRGRIIWMLMTCRPDLLPIDIKRQGRAEVHIPLFYPQDAAETRAMFAAMARKNKVKLADESLPALPREGQLSGADIESILLAARRRVLTEGRETVTTADLTKATEEFLPSTQGLEKELQELAAVLECTQMSFLPPVWQDRVRQPNGRLVLQERVKQIMQIIEE